jgi:hypothetical protein
LYPAAPDGSLPDHPRQRRRSGARAGVAALAGDRQLVSLRGEGLAGGGQGASGMFALGGTSRLHELVGAGPIRHVVKVTPFAARWCHYSPGVPGWRWPTKGADSYAAQGYHGSDPALVMATLLAIPPEQTAEKLCLAGR